jgi:hypothetical protein
MQNTIALLEVISDETELLQRVGFRLHHTLLHGGANKSNSRVQVSDDPLLRLHYRQSIDAGKVFYLSDSYLDFLNIFTQILSG